MAEFITEFPVSLRLEDSKWHLVEPLFERRERIVRCRDCKFCEDGYCVLLEFSDGRMDDGFCKWGEERES